LTSHIWFLDEKVRSTGLSSFETENISISICLVFNRTRKRILRDLLGTYLEGVWTEDIDGSKVTICLNHLIKKRTKIFSHFLVLLYQFLPTWSIKTLLLSLEKLTSLLVILSFHIWVS